MKNIVNLLIFVFGFTIGAISTYKYSEKKFKRISDEEIRSVKEAYKKRKSKDENSSDDEIEENKATISNVDTNMEKELSEYYAKIYDAGYSNYSDIEHRSASKPYVIHPNEACEKEEEGYSFVSLSYYTDGIITDDNDEILEDIEGTIGEESLKHFGEYEDDSVYVRNDRLKIDYEILLEQRPYSEVLEKKPYLRRE